MINTGFSWVRIDKGNIHCNFRYLDREQVDAAIYYLQSFYEYHNVEATVVDLGDIGGADKAGDHYRPSEDDPNKHYYYLVQLHRHGTIIPQGCIDILRTALNGIATHAILPESVFINRLSSNRLTVGSVAELTANSSTTVPGDFVWSSSDPTVLLVEADPEDNSKCNVTAVTPGDASVYASVTLPKSEPLQLKEISVASAYWVGNVYQYIGNTITFDPIADKDKIRKYGINGFVKDNYYECVFDPSAATNYKWVDSDYEPGTPLMVTYRNDYDMIVETYVKILTDNIQRVCLHSHQEMRATTPSSGLLNSIKWSKNSDIIAFDNNVSVGEQITFEAKAVGNCELKATVTDAHGSYSDKLPLTIYAMDVKPDTIKMIYGGVEKYLYIAKKDIFNQTVYVSWVTSNEGIATIEPANLEPGDVVNYTRAKLKSTNIGGQAFITAIAEDPIDGKSYTDTVKVVVGNVAINVPENKVISLFGEGPHTLTLDCDLALGYSIAAEGGWTSGNTSVVRIDSVSGTDNNTVVLEGLAPGASVIRVTASNINGAFDTDQILIQVVEAEIVTAGEMLTFTHGQFDGHGVVDWNPTGEEGTVEVESTTADLATQEEVEEFVDDLFTPDEPEQQETSTEPETPDDPENSGDDSDPEGTDD